ncbi:hypothetical protein OROGR_021206 [Orobanche gracilis]
MEVLTFLKDPSGLEGLVFLVKLENHKVQPLAGIVGTISWYY